MKLRTDSRIDLSSMSESALSAEEENMRNIHQINFWNFTHNLRKEIWNYLGIENTRRKEHDVHMSKHSWNPHE